MTPRNHTPDTVTPAPARDQGPRTPITILESPGFVCGRLDPVHFWRNMECIATEICISGEGVHWQRISDADRELCLQDVHMVRRHLAQLEVKVRGGKERAR